MIEKDWRSRIVCDPEIHHGEPCIKGTRVPVAILVASLAEMTQEDLLCEYPQLTPADISSALLYAAEAARNTLVA
jgi:uncharacterized protein (DUF433 family)